jgi:ankyrin repeat protein
MNQRWITEPGRRHVLRLALGAGLLAAPAALRAQVAPSPTEARSYTGLHVAAWQGDAEAARRLIAAGAALNERDGHGRTPLHVAAHARQRELLRLLARAGAELGALDQDRYDAVTIAAVADDEPTLATLLELGASAKLVTSRYDGTALIAAAHLGHDGVVRRLIAAGAPLDHVNNLHWTALIESIVLGDGGPRHQATLQALIQAGASVQLADRQGATPLQLARGRGYTAMVRMLEAAGAR